jgi:TonB family protein
MRYVFAIAYLFMLAWLPAGGQQNTLAIRPPGAELTAPSLVSPTVTVSTPKHCDEFNGVVKFAATIDAVGLPHALKALEASDRRLIGFATELIQAQRFKPGVVNGLPTAVAVELTVGLHTCAQREKHPTDDNFYQFTLRAHPLIAMAMVAPPAEPETASAAVTEGVPAGQVGEHISAPIPTVITDPKIPVSGKIPKRGHCFLGVTIDANGIPQNIHVVHELEPELDSNAMEAVRNWRFKPALRDGSTPVAAEGTVVATFEYVEKEPVAFAIFIPETSERVLAANAHDRKQDDTLEAINADEVIARYMPQSRIAGRVLVSLVIDTNGVPQNVHIIKSLDSRAFLLLL